MERDRGFYSEDDYAIIKQLYVRREKLAIARDIVLLEVEIKELQNQLKTNGNTDSEEG